LPNNPPTAFRFPWTAKIPGSIKLSGILNFSFSQNLAVATEIINFLRINMISIIESSVTLVNANFLHKPVLAYPESIFAQNIETTRGAV
jgi:hypothetical protein